jgi:hypothetical protein
LDVSESQVPSVKAQDPQSEAVLAHVAYFPAVSGMVKSLTTDEPESKTLDKFFFVFARACSVLT